MTGVYLAMMNCIDLNLTQSRTDDAESLLELDEIGKVTEELVNPAWQIKLEVDSDGVQELPDSLNQELTFDELIEICMSRAR
ncbi:hypothetical protein TNCV_4502641 [Trichonephila clavipes]|nr:hypothetical protein TNCV_4502641 [Trichonephila clavipes]